MGYHPGDYCAYCAREEAIERNKQQPDCPRGHRRQQELEVRLTAIMATVIVAIPLSYGIFSLLQVWHQ